MRDEFARLVEIANARGLVMLAGAGISMPPPSCLPGWTDFNNAVLGGLSERAERLTRGELTAVETMRGLQTLRDTTGALPIDFQAQLMQEECGPAYFGVLQTLDGGAPNGCHAAIAALAAAGVLKALVTTNFDRLCERALEAAGIPFRVFCSPDHFDALGTALAVPGVLPVIKVHGSAESPDSMVDTLQQRLLGRPAPLIAALKVLFSEHALVIAGFSGADLAYDEEYLGLRAGAAASSCVVVLTRAGYDPLPAMAALIAGSPHASNVPGTLPDALVEVGTAFGVSIAVPAAGDADAIRTERHAALATGVGQWVETVGDLAAVNILTSVIEGVSPRAVLVMTNAARGEALQAADRTSDGYWRFQVNFGRHLLERGYFGQDLSARETIDAIGTGALDEADFDDAFRILTRASMRGNRIDALGLAARTHAYRGEFPVALELVKSYRTIAVEHHHRLAIFEAFLSGAVVHTMIGNWSGGLEWLEGAYPTLKQYGDEPRRARLCAELGRFLAWAERYDEAERFLDDGLTIAHQLKLGLLMAHLHAARGYFELDRGQDYPKAVAHLSLATKTFAAAELTSLLLPVLLDLAEAAYRADQADLTNRALGMVSDQLDRYPGFLGHYYRRAALIYILGGEHDDARTFLAKLQQVGTAQRNEWLNKSADSLETIIRKREETRR